MWRLLVVLALCGASLGQGEEGSWASCNNIRTNLQNLSLAEGNWTAYKKIQKRSLFYPASTICYLTEISNTSNNGLTLTTETRYKQEEDGGLVVENNRLEFKVIGGQRGRYGVENVQDNEMLLLSNDPSNYLAMILCNPARRVTRQQANLGDTVVWRVFFFTRRQGSINLSGQNLAKKIDDTIKTLGLENYYQQGYTNPNC